MPENFYTEILFQGLTTGLKTNNDVVKYANALTELFSASDYKSFEACAKAAAAIRNAAIAKAAAEYAKKLGEIDAAFSGCVGTSRLQSGNTNPSDPTYVACVEARDTARIAAKSEKDLAEQLANDEYSAAIAACVKQFGRPRVVSPTYRRDDSFGVGISTGGSTKTKT